MAAMTKTELIKGVSEDCELSQAKTKEVVDYIFDSIVEQMEAGNEVNIHKFGKFHTSETAKRKGRNPQTGKEIDIAARTSPKLKFSKHVKDTVNG